MNTSTSHFFLKSLLIGFLIIPSIVSAAAPAGGYAPGGTLDPDCAPVDLDCTVYPMWNYNVVDGFVYNDNGDLIGIGTDTPTSDLTVNGTVGFDHTFADTSSTQYQISDNIFGFGLTGQVMNFIDTNGDSAYHFAGDIFGTTTASLGTTGIGESTNTLFQIRDDQISMDSAFTNGHSSYIRIETPTVSGYTSGRIMSGIATPADNLDVVTEITAGRFKINHGDATGSYYDLNNDNLSINFLDGSGLTAAALSLDENGVFNVLGNGTGGSDYSVEFDDDELFFNLTGVGVSATLGAGGWNLSNLTGGATNLTVDASGNIIRDPSDANLKTDVVALTSALDKVNQLRPVSYAWKDPARFGSGREIGFIAQEIQQIIPEVVSQGGEYLSVNYGDLTALNAAAIQELDQKITESQVIYALAEGDERTLEGIFQSVIEKVREMVLTTITAVTGIFDRVETKELCVEGVCITGEELSELLNNAHISVPVDQPVESLNEEVIVPPLEDVEVIEVSSDNIEIVVEEIIEVEEIVQETPTQSLEVIVQESSIE